MATLSETDVDKLIEDNMGLVYNIISNRFLQYINDDDIVQCGRIGLWKAAKSFNPNLGFQFCTYAGTCIENEIKMEFRRNSRVIPSYITGFISLDAPISSDESESSFVSDIISDTYSRMEESETLSVIQDILDTLNERDRQIIQFYMEDYNQKDIGKMTGLSQPHVSRRIKAIMKQIRQKLEE